MVRLALTMCVCKESQMEVEVGGGGSSVGGSYLGGSIICPPGASDPPIPDSLDIYYDLTTTQNNFTDHLPPRRGPPAPR